MAHLVLALDRGLTLADTRQELRLARLTGAFPRGEDLPLNPSARALAQDALRQGDKVWLVAGDGVMARAVLDRAGLSDGGVIELRDGDGAGAALAALRGRIGPGSFAYLGHDPSDRPLWQAAGSGWIVDGDPQALIRAGGPSTIALPGRDATGARALWQALRSHHWIKNLLVFLPLLAAHRWTDLSAYAGSLLAFAVFCLTSSAIYLANDLFDLADDRRRPQKRHRPLAAGQLGVDTALSAFGGLLALALALAWGLAATPSLALVTLVYAFAALAYSHWLKTLRFVDLAWLGGLYGLRVIAGGAAAGIALSGWLVVLCLFLFTALACIKRAAELVEARRTGGNGISRRGYRPGDLAAVTILGAMAALGAGLVLVAYAFDVAAARLYARPWLLVLASGWIMLWVLRLWRKVSAEGFGGDPILFALRDRASWVLALCLALTLACAVG